MRAIAGSGRSGAFSPRRRGHRRVDVEAVDRRGGVRVRGADRARPVGADHRRREVAGARGPRPGRSCETRPEPRGPGRRSAGAPPSRRGRGAGRGGRSLLPLPLPLPHTLAELLHHRRVAERRHVAELAALGDVAQQAAHDLAGARLRQVVGPDDALRPGELADPLRDVVADLLDRARRRRRDRPRGSRRRRSTGPVSSSVWPMTAASATFGWQTIADSISAVDMRWPETLITSSTRPITQK